MGEGGTLTFNNILFGVMSGNLLPSNHMHILTNRTTALGVYSISKINLITDWSVENMNDDITSNRMLLDVSVTKKFSE